jgi:hypothetical protein
MQIHAWPHVPLFTSFLTNCIVPDVLLPLELCISNSQRGTGLLRRVPAFPVDTHIHRLAQRWGLTSGSSVEQTEADLKAIFEEEHWNKLHLQVRITHHALRPWVTWCLLCYAHHTCVSGQRNPMSARSIVCFCTHVCNADKGADAHPCTMHR